MSVSFTFQEEHFNQIFPFYILINQQMVVESNGKTLEKIFAGTSGKKFQDNYKIKRPKLETLDFLSLKSIVNQMLVIECFNEQSLNLRGQIDYLPETGQLLFLGSPWFDSIDDVAKNNLSLHDFAHHDAMTDLLHVMKTVEITNEDLKHLLKTVNIQKEDLKIANKAVHDIALFPQQNPDPLIRIDFAGNLLQNNPAASHLDFIEYKNKRYRNDDFFKLISNKIDKKRERWIIEAVSNNKDYSFVCITMPEEGYINIYGRDITRQKKDQQELVNLSLIVQQTNNAVIITNASGKIEWINNAFEKITEYNITEVKGLKPGSFLQGKETSKEAVAYMQESIANSKPFTCEILNYSKSGKPYWLRINAQPIMDNQGKLVNYFAIEEDITAEREIQNKLEKQRVFYEQILNNIPSDIAVFNNKHTYLYLNREAVNDEELRKWLIGKKDEDYIKAKNKPLSLLENRRNLFNEVMESRQLKSWEERIQMPDGEVKTKMRNFFPVVNDIGEVELIIGYGMDITEIKNIQQQIEDSQNRYKDVIENSLAIITTHDMDGNFITVNPMVSSVYGYKDSEMVGQEVSSFIPKDDRSFFVEGYLKKIKKEKKATGIFRVLHKNGKIVYSLYNNFLKEEQGKEPYVIGFAVDITDRIKAEKELKYAKKQTEELAQSKQNFLANMSHEIRTPMNAIMGMANQLNKTNLLPQQHFYLNTIQSAADNLLVIINDILDISKMEAGKLTLENIGFEPKQIVGRSMQVMMHKAEEKGLAFTNSFCDGRLFPVLIGDPYRLNQVLLNLISNAIKFTEKGTIDIQCKVVGDTNEQQIIEGIIIDTGIGMEESFAKNLFQKFKQEDESVTRRFGGTGLGMSICKDLVELMSGTIEVESKKGVGTKVSFTIPFKKGTVTDLPVKSAEIIDEVMLKEKQILVVDDNEMNRLVASTILNNFGVIVQEASNGKDAIELLQHKQFDLVLMDVQMPIMDGLEATKIIRETISKDLPIIALTAFAVKGDKEKIMRTGMNDYLSKPFEEDKLLAIITKWIGIQISTPTANTVMEIETEVIEDPLFDLTKLEDIAKGNSGFVSKMIGLFVEQGTISLNEINESFEKNDFIQISKIAHRMKPSLDNLGIDSIKMEIRDIEKNAVEYGAKGTLQPILEKINAVIGKAVIQLKKQL